MAASVTNPIARFFRLRKPCGNCPFRKVGAIDLAPGRVEGIVRDLLKDDRASFECHKTACARRGTARRKAESAMCSGAAAILMKLGRPNIAMRLAFATGDVRPEDLERLSDAVIDLPGIAASNR